MSQAILPKKRPATDMDCPNCGATWKPRKAHPLKCPRCWLPLNPKKQEVTP